MNTNSSPQITAQGFTKRLALLSIIGLSISLLLLYHHTTLSHGLQDAPSFCSLGENFNCDKVAKSSYAEWFGIPVASYGALFYIALLGLTFLARKEKRLHPKAYGDALLLSSSVALFLSIVLLLISIIEIKTLCTFCFILDIINILIFILAFRNSKRTSPFWESLKKGISSFLGFPPFGLGGVLFAAVFGTLLYHTPSFFLEYSIIPQVKLERQKAYVQKALHNWSKQPEATLPITEEGDSKDFSIGPPDALLTVVTFSDFECPFCQHAGGKLKKLQKAFPEEMRIVFKNYPLDQSCNKFLSKPLHSFACHAAELAHCAGLEKKEHFWFVHDGIFDLEEINTKTLEDLPQQLGVYSQQLRDCLASGAAKEKIKADIALGKELGIAGTPTLFANGKKLHPPMAEAVPLLLEQIKAN